MTPPLELGLVAAATGFLGGVHCAGMCGGVAGAVCAPAPRGSAWRYALAFNGGRLAAYAAAGALAGALGQAGLAWRGDALLQQLMFALASAMLVALGLYLAGIAPFVRHIEAAGTVVWRRLQPCTRWFMPVTSASRAFGLGALWGWVPCGLVYAVLLTALATGGAWQGAAVMLAFGLGTLPNLLAIGVLVQRAAPLARRRLMRISAGTLVAAFGLYGLLQIIAPMVSAGDGLFYHVGPGHR